MLLKLIILGLVIYGVYRFFGGELKLPQMKKDNKKLDEDTMIECSKCGTFVSKKEAMSYKGKEYCSKECLPN
jgi:uncharacterized protein